MSLAEYTLIFFPGLAPKAIRVGPAGTWPFNRETIETYSK